MGPRFLAALRDAGSIFGLFPGVHLRPPRHGGQVWRTQVSPGAISLHSLREALPYLRCGIGSVRDCEFCEFDSSERVPGRDSNSVWRLGRLHPRFVALIFLNEM